jgi:hypothetical protein
MVTVAGECKTVVQRLVESGRIDMGLLDALAGDHKVGLLAQLGLEYTMAENG